VLKDQDHTLYHRFHSALQVAGRASNVSPIDAEDIPQNAPPIEGGRPLPSTGKVLSISFAPSGQLRSRKVVTRSRARSTGKYPSWKMNRMLQWESPNELNAFRLLDCDPEVVCFTEQPCEIRYLQDGIARKHFPDILVVRNGRRELLEVKSEPEAIRPAIASRTTLLMGCLPMWGYDYSLVLGSDLARQPRMKNADRLLRFGRGTVTECEREFMRLALKRHGPLVWAEACAGSYGARGREIVCRLVLDGTLAFDMNAAWSADTLFFAGKGGI
jgi:hypothetical protein